MRNVRAVTVVPITKQGAASFSCLGSSITILGVMTPDPLLRFRDEFPILATSTYLVSNSLGAMPRTVPDKLAEYTEQWRTRGVRAWAEGWWELPVTMGTQLAPLIGKRGDRGFIVLKWKGSVQSAPIRSRRPAPAGSAGP